MQLVNPPVFLYNIKVENPLKQIYTRLGFHKYLTELQKDQKEKIDNMILKGISYCDVSGTFIKIPIKSKDEHKIELANGIIWESKDVSRFLDNSDDVFIMGATAGKKIIDLREFFLEKDETFNSVIIDAVGSEMVEAGIEWVNEFLRKKILIEGKTLTKRRYSPGYGDLKLSNQMEICNSLEINKLGIALNSNFILFPEKSVTAIIGII